jgi:hypothetical protein
MELGICRADHATPFYPLKLALTSPTSGCRSVGVVRTRTKATELVRQRYNCSNRLSVWKFGARNGISNVVWSIKRYAKTSIIRLIKRRNGCVYADSSIRGALVTEQTSGIETYPTAMTELRTKRDYLARVNHGKLPSLVRRGRIIKAG